MLGPLAQRVASGELAALASQPEALRLVLPAVISRLQHAASTEANPDTGRNLLQVFTPLSLLLLDHLFMCIATVITYTGNTH